MKYLFLSTFILINNLYSIYHDPDKLTTRSIVLPINNRKLTKADLSGCLQDLQERPDLLFFSVHGIKNSLFDYLKLDNFKNANNFSKYEIIDGFELIYDNKIDNDELLVFKKTSFNHKIEIDEFSDLNYNEYVYYKSLLNTRLGAQSITLTIDNTFKLQLVSANLFSGFTKFYERTMMQRKISKNLVWGNPAHLTIYFGSLQYRLDFLLNSLRYESRRKILWYYSNITSHVNEQNYYFFKHKYPSLFIDHIDYNDPYRDLLNEYDQLKFSQEQNFGFKDYKEPKITFKPNYNVHNTDILDYRVPFYKHRILYKTASSRIDLMLRIDGYKLLDEYDESIKVKTVLMDAAILLPNENTNINTDILRKDNRNYRLKIIIPIDELKRRNKGRKFKVVKFKVYNYNKDNNDLRNQNSKKENIVVLCDDNIDNEYKLISFINLNEGNIANNKNYKNRKFIEGNISLKITNYELFRLVVVVTINDGISIVTETTFSDNIYVLDNIKTTMSYLKDENGNVVGKTVLSRNK